MKDLVGFINRPRRAASPRVRSRQGLCRRWRFATAQRVFAVPISRVPRDCLIFFRREVTQSVNWGGAPEKVYTTGPHGPRLTPRKSFNCGRRWFMANPSLGPSHLHIAEPADHPSGSDPAPSPTSPRASARARRSDRLMIAELNHRVRNILGLARGLVAQSKDTATSIEEFSAFSAAGSGAGPRPTRSPA